MTPSVLIVGAGPTGLTAALELSRFGIPVRLIDKRAAPSETSRAIGVQARTLELLDRRGLADELVRVGNPTRRGMVAVNERPMVRPDFGDLPDTSFPMLLFVSQAETERVLREALARQGVTIERGVELMGVAQEPRSQDPEPVGAIFRHADGRLEATRCAYLISAEGAHSLVRETAGVGFEGMTFNEEFALGDVHYDGDLPSDEFAVFGTDEGFLAHFPLGPDHTRLIVSKPPGSSARGTPPTLEELQAVYNERSPIPARLHDLAWSSWFRINSRMVRSLRAGRFFFGGDSAHIHSPAGAQGMNTGIQDMINLGWKLALVLKGQAPADLLDTYDADRLPVIRSVLRMTETLTQLLDSANPIVRGLRDHLAPYVDAAGLASRRGASTMSQTALGYRPSPLSSQHARGAGLHAGDRLPDLAATIDEGWTSSLHRLLDPSHFALLAPRANGTLSAIRETVRPWGDLVAIRSVSPPADPEGVHRFDATFGRGPGLFLVRPDGYVGLAATGSHAAHHLLDYCQRWLISQGDDAP